MKNKAKKLLLILSLIIIIPGWLIITGISLYCSINLTCNPDASNWWSLFITIIGVPIVAFQLYALRETIEKTILKPEVDFGIYLYKYTVTDGLNHKSLNTTIQLPLSPMDELILNSIRNPDMYRFYSDRIDNLLSPVRFVIKNSGKLALKFVKIEIKLKSCPGDIPPVIAINGYKYISEQRALFLRGGSETVIYPGDIEEYQLNIIPDQAQNYFMLLKQALNSDWIPDIGEIYKQGRYEFSCKIWSEKLDEAFSKDLILEIIDDREGINPEIYRKKRGSSKFGFETAEDRTRGKIEEQEKEQRLEEEQKKREDELHNKAIEINPRIQDVLNDYISAYELRNYVIKWDGVNSWLISVDRALSYRDEVISLSLIYKDTGICLKLDHHKPMNFSPSAGLDDLWKLPSTSKLADVIKNVTNIPVEFIQREVQM